MPRATAETLTRMGAPAGPFASRPLSGALVDSADLVLTAQREHLHESLLLRPGASRRCFLLLEFIRLIPFASAAGWVPNMAGGTQDRPRGDDIAMWARAMVSAAAGIRGRIPYVDPAADEIADPASPDALWLCAVNIDRAVRPAINALCGNAGPETGTSECPSTDL